MDLDDFFGSLLQDGASIASTASTVGAGAIASDISGYNLTPYYLQKQGLLGNVAGGNQQLLLLILMGFAIYMIVKHG